MSSPLNSLHDFDFYSLNYVPSLSLSAVQIHVDGKILNVIKVFFISQMKGVRITYIPSFRTFFDVLSLFKGGIQLVFDRECILLGSPFK